MDFLTVEFSDGDCGAASVVAGFEALAGAAARGEPDAALELDVAEDADLPAEHDVLACFGRAGDACLGGDHIVLANFDVVGNLDEIVYFRAFADDRLLKAGAIDAGIGSDFYVVF